MGYMRCPKYLSLMTYTMKPVIKEIVCNKCKYPSNPKTAIHSPEGKMCFNLIVHITTKAYLKNAARTSYGAHEKTANRIIQSVGIFTNDLPVS